VRSPSRGCFLTFTAAAILLLSTGLFAAAETKAENAEVDKVFADLQKPGSPGCAVAVLRDGTLVYAKGYGLASIELNAPITPATVFDIGSTSKQFTAASILLLEQQGKLSINDDVRKYIPELPDYSQSNGRPVTILNLLNHTSGLRDYLSLLQFSGASIDSVTTEEDALALVIRQKALNFPPGSDWVYSNTGFFLLSTIVKRVSGMTLREFASRNIFQPLGMMHTNFRDDHTMLIPNRALAYDPGEKAGYKLDVSYYEQLGDGAVHTSVEDLANWDENFYSAKVGGKSLIANMQEPGQLNSGKKLDYAKGLFIQETRGLHTVRHGGAWGGYRAELLRFPDQHFSVVCLCNVANARPSKRADRMAEVFLGTLMKPAEASADVPQAPGVALTAAQRQPLTGMYRDPVAKTVARIVAIDGKLQVEIMGSTFALRAKSSTELLPVDLPGAAGFSFEAPNQAGYQRMRISGEEPATYERVTPAVPSTKNLSAYAGDFESEELGVVYQLRVVDSKLQLTRLSDSSGLPRTGFPLPMELVPTIPDEFEISSQGITINFVRNGENGVAGFGLSQDRVQGITFLELPRRVSPTHNSK
jgi:CubicO group peptidase (beta-lactamase class C family)